MTDDYIEYDNSTHLALRRAAVVKTITIYVFFAFACAFLYAFDSFSWLGVIIFMVPLTLLTLGDFYFMDYKNTFRVLGDE